MKATIDYVKKKFNEYNELCFEGKLKPLPFRLSHARTALGQVKFMKEKNTERTARFNELFRQLVSAMSGLEAINIPLI